MCLLFYIDHCLQWWVGSVQWSQLLSFFSDLRQSGDFGSIRIDFVSATSAFATCFNRILCQTYSYFQMLGDILCQQVGYEPAIWYLLRGCPTNCSTEAGLPVQRFQSGLDLHLMWPLYAGSCVSLTLLVNHIATSSQPMRLWSNLYKTSFIIVFYWTSSIWKMGKRYGFTPILHFVFENKKCLYNSSQWEGLLRPHQHYVKEI